MDPQRQYAQLLPLWAQGNKILRRQFNGVRNAAALQAWQLGQSLASHDVAVLPLQLQPVIFLLSGKEDGRGPGVVLVDSEFGHVHAAWFRRPIYLTWLREVQMSFAGTWTVSAEVARKFGPQQWRTLDAQMNRACGSGQWNSLADVQTVLAGLAHEPDRIGSAPAQDWLTLARLWRHRGIWQESVGERLGGYPWICCDAVAGKCLWPIEKDEDSVH